MRIVRGEDPQTSEKAERDEERAEIEAVLLSHLLAYDDSKEAELRAL